MLFRFRYDIRGRTVRNVCVSLASVRKCLMTGRQWRRCSNSCRFVLHCSMMIGLFLGQSCNVAVMGLAAVQKSASMAQSDQYKDARAHM